MPGETLLRVLEQPLNGRYRVFGKMRLGDIVRPQKGSSKVATFVNFTDATLQVPLTEVSRAKQAVEEFTNNGSSGFGVGKGLSGSPPRGADSHFGK